MAVKVEVIRPEPVQNEVVIRLPERKARELMSTLMNDLIWDRIAYGNSTIADVFNALEDAGVKEA